MHFSLLSLGQISLTAKTMPTGVCCCCWTCEIVLTKALRLYLLTDCFSSHIVENKLPKLYTICDCVGRLCAVWQRTLICVHAVWVCKCVCLCRCAGLWFAFCGFSWSAHNVLYPCLSCRNLVRFELSTSVVVLQKRTQWGAWFHPQQNANCLLILTICCDI